MLRTRVGYAGGKKDKPMYRSIGDHTEAIQIEFDPKVITFEQLLTVFWDSHSPCSRPWSTQYKAVLWTHDAAQAAAAKKSLAAITKAKGRKPTTEVAAATRFWIAEDYHQKYRLRSHKKLMHALFGAKASGATIRESTLAARANGWLSGYGTPAQIAKALKALGVDAAARKALDEALGSRAK